MKKFSLLKTRIREYFDSQGVDIREIYKNTGISDGTFSNKSGLNENNILKFFSYYTDIDANWLIKGEKKATDKKIETTIENIDFKDKYYDKIEKIESLQDEIILLNKKLKTVETKLTSFKKDNTIVLEGKLIE